MMDHRDVAANVGKWYEAFDEKTMIASVEMENDDGGFDTWKVPVKFVVCPTCNGKGSHANPCNECYGQRVVPEVGDRQCNLKVSQAIRDKITWMWTCVRSGRYAYLHGERWVSDVPKRKWELWTKPGEQEFHPADHPQHAFLSDGMEKVWEVWAESYEDAMTQYHEYMGWEPYVPVD